MLFPLTTRIPDAPVWSIEGVISHAKIQDKKPIVRYFLLLCCFYTVHCFKTKPLFFLQSNVSIHLTVIYSYYMHETSSRMKASGPIYKSFLGVQLVKVI
jgi:hypothetical protein